MTVRQLRWATFGWCAAMVVVLVAAPDLRFLDARIGGSTFVDAARPAAIVVFAVGAVAAFAWPIAGAVLVAFGGGMISAFALGQLSPASGALVLLVFTVAAVLLSALGLRTSRRKIAVGGLVAVVLVTAAGALASAELYDEVYGPTHPDSSAPDLSQSAVRWIWSGAVTESTATVTAKLHDAGAAPRTRLAIATGPDLDGARFVRPSSFDGQGVARFDVRDLAPATTYHYAVEVGGELDRVRAGRLRTFGDGPQSFTVAIGGCARVGSNGAVFDAIRALDPALFVILGDWHYANIDEDDPAAFRDAADLALEKPGPSALYRSTPVAYMWDDHDYGANNADARSDSRAAAMRVYREVVPHYGLAGDDTTIHQAFTIGRVRFVVTDARSGRTPSGEPDDERKSMLGPEQRAWLERELLAARDTASLVVWVNPVPWIDEADEDADTWGGYSTERRELADFIAANDIDNLVMVAGDAHMVAIDDGTNTDYSTNGGASFPLLHAAALDRRGQVKGGPYSEGARAGGGQFGVVEVVDEGAEITVRLSARDWSGDTLLQHQVIVPDRP